MMVWNVLSDILLQIQVKYQLELAPSFCLSFDLPTLGPQPVLRVPSVQHHPVDCRQLLLLRHLYIYYLHFIHRYLTL